VSQQTKQHKQQGFTLIELIIVMSIASLILFYTIQTDITKRELNDINSKIDTAKNDITQIQQAAGGYLVDNNQWPDYINACVGALTTLTTTTPTAYLRYISIQSPYYTNYTTSCNTTTFTISVNTNTNNNALRLANSLSAATATANTVIATIPRPEEQPTLTRFLMLDGSRAMTGDLDMGGNAITNTSHISTLDNRTISKIETIAPLPTATILKPICPTGTTPTLNLAITGIVLTSGKLPYSHPPFIESQTPTQWTVRLNVYDEDGAATATTGTYVLATSSCN
jgi:prepilin-type N-terminal cleavage/methylation domain-containing protein